jgi:hypothetical protein
MSGGVATALEQVLDGQAGGQVLEQAGLFDDFDATEVGALDAPSPLTKALTPPKRGPGRRPGSKNRRTEAVVGWLLSQHRHPLSVMMEAYGMTPAELAKQIGIAAPSDDQLLDLLKLQLRMAEAVAPYVAQRLPQAVVAEGGSLLQVNIGGVNLGGGVSSPARAGSAENPAAIEGQVLAVRLPVKSDDPAG